MVAGALSWTVGKKKLSSGRDYTLSARPAMVLGFDPLEAISRQGAQRMLTVALEREVEEYLERQRYVRHVDESEFRGYRNGYGRERQVTIGSGTIKVRAPRVSDTPAEQDPFESKILKPYQRRSQELATTINACQGNQEHH